MKITLEEYGGMAAGIPRPFKVLDSSVLPDSSKAELSRLIEKASSASAEKAPGRVRDGMGYKITVEDGNRPVVLNGSDGSMSPEFTELLESLEHHLAKKGK